MDTYSALDSQSQYGPAFEFEYSTREVYGNNIPWGENDPLNATWWHLVTERECLLSSYDLRDTEAPSEMEANSSLVSVSVSTNYS